jgi:hypothetical protein
MADTFRTRTDQNGVETSDNSHSAESYSHPLSEQKPAHPRWMTGEDDRGGYMQPPVESIVEKTRDRVVGSRSHLGAMTFGSDLLPRSERISREEAGPGVERHDPSCWCDMCHPPQMAASMEVAAPSPRHRR